MEAYTRAKWRILIATMFCYLFYYTGRQTFGFAIPFIEEDLGLSKTRLGAFGTALLWAYAVGQAVNGNLGDKFGGRRMMSLGAVLSCGLNWGVSIGTGFWSLFVPWAANGLAQSMGWAPGSRVLSNWWGRHERAIAFGLYMFAAGMSSVLAFVTPLLILKTLGLDWRWIFRLPVLLLLVGGVVYFVVVRDRPEELGLAPPADLDEDEQAGPKQETESSFSRYLAVLNNGRFLVASLGIGFQSAARYGLLLWVPVHFLGADWKQSNAAWISVALPVGMALGAATGGWVSDKVFKSVRWKLIVTFMSLGAVAAGGMYFLPRGHLAGIAVLFLCGFFAYGSQSAFWALCPDLLGTKRAGTGVGIMDFFAYLFAGVVSPFIGWLIETHQVVHPVTGELADNTALVFPIVAGACILCVLVGWVVRR